MVISILQIFRLNYPLDHREVFGSKNPMNHWIFGGKEFTQNEDTTREKWVFIVAYQHLVADRFN